MDFEVNQEYGELLIEKFAIENDYSMQTVYANEFNRTYVGETFIVLRHPEKDFVISFVLTGGNNNQYIYKCIYKD